MKLASFLNNHTRTEDNLLLIRLSLALMVFAGHLWTVKEGKMQLNLLGFLAVNGFFVISGFLLSWSLLRDRDPARYLMKRALRIYPALGVSLIYTVFIVGVMLTDQNVFSFIRQPETIEYTLKNFILLMPEIPQKIPTLFSNAPFQFPNAPLWTLKYEMFLYIVLICIATFICAQDKRTRIVVVVILIAFSFLRSDLFDHYLLRLGLCFSIGCLCFLMRNYIPLSLVCCVISITFLMCAKIASKYSFLPTDIYYVILYCTQGYLIFCGAYLIRISLLLQFNRLGDYSYGVYIFGYPTQQTINAIYPNMSMPIYAVVTIVLTMTLAVLSWHLVEKRLIMH